MNSNCIECLCISEMFQDLMNIYEDGDPIKMMDILMSLNEMGTKSGLLTDSDRSQITLFNHVLALIGQQKVEDYKQIIEKLKTPL